MNCLSWNCWVLENTRIITIFNWLIEEKRLKLVFLMETKCSNLVETKCSNTKMKKIRRIIKFDNYFSIVSLGLSGGLTLLWCQNLDLNIQTYSNWHISTIVNGLDCSTKCNITCFYRHLEASKRESSWSLLKHLKPSNNEPWFCFRDFNEITCQGEKRVLIWDPKDKWMHYRRLLFLVLWVLFQHMAKNSIGPIIGEGWVLPRKVR